MLISDEHGEDAAQAGHLGGEVCEVLSDTYHGMQQAVNTLLRCVRSSLRCPRCRDRAERAIHDAVAQMGHKEG